MKVTYRQKMLQIILERPGITRRELQNIPKLTVRGVYADSVRRKLIREEKEDGPVVGSLDSTHLFITERGEQVLNFLKAGYNPNCTEWKGLSFWPSFSALIPEQNHCPKKPNIILH